MPAYDFQCRACGTTFEVTRPIGDATPVVCPACGSDTRRLFTPVGVVFKGSGFHNTDYRPKPNANESSPGGKDSCGNAGSSPSCGSCPAAD